MTWEMVFVLFTVGCMMCGLFFEIARPALIIFLTLTFFTITGIITPQEAAQGFSNQAMLTIAMLFIIAGTIKKSGIIDRLITNLLNSHDSTQKALLKMIIPFSGFSAFLNNTPIVITLTPVIRNWCEANKISPSKFLIPLSYATILGGTITLIGTSTNLIVNELMLKEGWQGFSIFTLSIIGLPITILGIIYLITIGHRILPNHKVMTEMVKEKYREYLGEVLIDKGCPLTHCTINEAGLRNLKGIYFISIIRGNERITPIKSTTIIKPGDRLIFTGDLSTISEIQNIKGIHLETNTCPPLDELKTNKTKLVEAVVSHHSSLLHKKIKDTQFRAKYDCAVIAVHRSNERIKSKIGDIVLKPGDTLLLITGPDFQKSGIEHDFYVMTHVSQNVYTKSDRKKGWISISIFFIMLSLVSFHVVSMFTAVLITTTLLLLFRIITPSEVKQYIQFNVLMIIACSLGIGTALSTTGTAQWIANKLVLLIEPFGVIAMLVTVYIITNIFTEFITNNAAAVIMFPIIIEISNQVQIDPFSLAVIVTIAASASFITPIGYQTNLIVYGPGGYTFKDYIKVGIPLSFLVMVTTILVVYVTWI
ncbi:SLC13 family permease [Alteribacillus bidgolensis]|uniref:Di-and tricarboxylate transporter n=1 Tax=Alteribacillus bidgolensis TaxID=930129 RepID=A0A1G8I3I5_9BACI|nr:SLC13 family permease [Alteribacillus bidgolensis]SDI13417.1 Di-and tricarboxylate transporter [Alteribacillus bidgolensis]